MSKCYKRITYLQADLSLEAEVTFLYVGSSGLVYLLKGYAGQRDMQNPPRRIRIFFGASPVWKPMISLASGPSAHVFAAQLL
jgi:hypothetical protein